MPKCLECGLELPRLQWTHFRFNCTGKFKNGTEYREVYTNAKLVDDDLVSKTAITKENLIKKYGTKEGSDRWDRYIERQRESNTFEYKSKKHGWTKEQFDDYNKSRSQTLENCILRYGETEGLNKWQDYCDRQSYTNSIEYFIEKYGVTDGTIKWNEFYENRIKVHRISFIMEKFNCNESMAANILSSRKSKSYVSLVEKEFVNKLLEKIEIKYSCNTSQYSIWSHDDSRLYVYDISNGIDKIIEFNGDYWHCNPAIYNESFIVKQSGLTAKETWRNDQNKIAAANLKGFNVLTIWESEYKLNPDNTIMTAFNFFNNGNKL
jgi:hypothetical protein